MILKKDLSFVFPRFTPFLGLYALHGAQRVIQLWINEHHTQSHVNQFQIDLYMTPNCRFSKNLPVSIGPCTWLLVRTWRVMISFTSQQFKHLSERDVSKKSNIDTTIDFLKYPNIQEFTLSLTLLFPKIIWNRGIITLVDQVI